MTLTARNVRDLP